MFGIGLRLVQIVTGITGTKRPATNTLRHVYKEGSPSVYREGIPRDQ